MKTEQLNYLNRIRVYLNMMDRAAKELNDAWDEEDNVEIDLNSFLSRLYPFQKSFNEMQRDIREWTRDFNGSLARFKDTGEVPPENIADPKDKIKKVCDTCGSEEVCADAYAEWDTDKQEWVLRTVYDKGHYCDQCDGECRIIDKPLFDKSDDEQV